MYENTNLLVESKGMMTYRQLSAEQKKCLDAAESAMKRAYAPYSHFYVGSAVLCLTNGELAVVSGANYENASYGLTICAERSTLCTAQNLGYHNIVMLAVIARAQDFDVLHPTAPCGACRQFIVEAAQRNNRDLEIVFSNTKKDNICVATIEALLPKAFGPRDLV